MWRWMECCSKIQMCTEHFRFCNKTIYGSNEHCRSEPVTARLSQSSSVDSSACFFLLLCLSVSAVYCLDTVGDMFLCHSQSCQKNSVGWPHNPSMSRSNRQHHINPVPQFAMQYWSYGSVVVCCSTCCTGTHSLIFPFYCRAPLLHFEL